MENGKIFELTLLDNNSENMNMEFRPADLKITVSLHGNMPRTMDYELIVYDELYTVMGRLYYQDTPYNYSYNGKKLECTMPIKQMWFAGNYFLMISHQHGDIERMTWKADFKVDKEMNFWVVNEEQCKGITPENTLMKYFNAQGKQGGAWFRNFNEIPGIFPIKRWLVRQKQWEWANDILQHNDANPIRFANNFLVIAKTNSYASQTMFLFHLLAFHDHESISLYCDQLYDPSDQEDPYKELHRIFPKNDAEWDIFSTVKNWDRRKRFYKINNLGILSTKEGEPILAKIISHALGNDPRIITIFYGTQEEVDRLFKVAPAMRTYFHIENQVNDIGLMTPAEMGRFFIWQAKARTIYFNQEAAFHLQRLIIEGYETGVLTNWTRDEVHDYVDNVIRPRLSERIMRQMNKNEDPKLVSLIHKEDLDDDAILHPKKKWIQPITLEDFPQMIDEPYKLAEEDGDCSTRNLTPDQEEFERLLQEFINGPSYVQDDDLDSIDELADYDPDDDDTVSNCLPIGSDNDEDNESDDDSIDWNNLPDIMGDDNDDDFPDGLIEQNPNSTIKVEVLKPLKHPKEELDKLVGCSDIKTRIEELTMLSQYNRMIQCLNPHGKRHRLALHSLFLGKPGTGKTTVCKIFGSMLKEAGVLSKGHVVVCGRSAFVGTNWGDEEKVVRQVVEMAQGGVLMIDEAYLLNGDNKSDPAKMVIPLLMNILADEDKRDIAIVLCGYKDEMNRLLELNPGLASRFPNRFEFPDFTIDELLEITRRRIHEYDYEFTRAAWTKYKTLIAEVYKLRDPKTWGNARFIANQLERIYIRHAERCVRHHVSDRRHLFLITPADIKPIDLPTPKPHIGF